MAKLVGASGSGAWIRIFILAAAIPAEVAALVMLAAPEARAAVTACPSAITACGCVITKPGSYDVQNDLDASQGLTSKGDCIDIKARNVTLDGEFEDITGTGTGVGIRILNGAAFATVSEFIVLDWGIGIEDDANNAAISDFASAENANAALILKGAKNSVVSGAEELGETVSGPCVILKNASNNTVIEAGVTDCTDGVDLVHSSKNTLAGLDVFGNAGNGIFLDPGSSNNALSFNRVGGFSDELDENGGNGIEIGKGSKRNKIIFNEVNTNDGTDLQDDNPDCDHDTWSSNCFDTGSPACTGVVSPCGMCL
jgi:parallel beta-helix repeat protein